MNWIGALNEKKANSDALTSSNPSGPISRSPLEDAQLVRLREVLSMEYWHFGPGSAGFDGFSQGVCFLGGIYPDDSHASPVYALRFLPDALKSYGFSHMPAPVDIGDLRAAVTESLNYLRGIPVNGLTAVKIAITAASKAGARLPWLAVVGKRRENKWRAARHGLDASVIHDNEGHQAPLREQLPVLIERLEPIAERLGCLSELRRTLEMLDTGASYERQRKQMATSGRLPDIVSKLADELRESVMQAA